MKTLLFYDTETTGLPLWKKPSEDPRQPHIVQLAALMTDEAGKKISSMDVLMCVPDGVEFSSEAVDIHGITPEHSRAYGAALPDSLPVFLAMWSSARLRIGHSESFDARMIRISLKRYFNEDTCAQWKEGEAFCTMRKSTSIVRVPPSNKMMGAGRKTFKNPTLGEAYEFFTGKALGEKAHNAMFDILACRAVYFGILQRA